MIFVAATISLLLQLKHHFTISDSRYIHAALLQAITKADPDAGQRLHDMGRYKRFTSAFVEQKDRMVKLRVTFIAQDGLEYAKLLVNALAQFPVMRLGGVSGEVVGVDLSTDRWSGIGTWADLLRGKPTYSMRLTFVTPTAITKRDGAGKRFSALYPDPYDVFSGLARRWDACGGPPLPPETGDFIRSGGCIVSKHQVQTTEFQMPERTQIGFVGHVVYECRRQEPAVVSALNGLARLAFFTGVGYQTTRGMGLTQVTIGA